MVNESNQKIGEINKFFIIALALLFLLISFFHWIIDSNDYHPILPILFAVIELILLVIIFSYVYYKKRNNVFVFIFIFLLLLFFYFQTDFIPSKTIIVYDVFSKPLNQIPVSFIDNLGSERICFESCGYVPRKVGKEDFYLTDTNGEVKLPIRVFFGQRKVQSIYVRVNSDYYFTAEKVASSANSDFDSKDLSLSHWQSELKVVLAPIKIYYKDCESVTEENNRQECLKYSSFYSAVQDKNPDLCSLAGVDFECLIFVKGILSGNTGVCNEIENTETRHFKDQCNCIFNPDSCKEVYYKEEVTLLKPLFGNASFVHDYLCHGKELREKGILGQEYQYSMFEIRYLDSAVFSYKRMFCD